MTAPSQVPAQDPRRLFVGWQDQETRAIEPVAALSRLPEGRGPRYRFQYIRRALALDRFEPFTAFPDMHRIYESSDLFPFFANRIMARKRPEYGQILEQLDLSYDAEPFEVLARSGGRRETDKLEVFPEPMRDDDGRATCLFFVRGLRYIPGSEDVAEDLKAKQQLRLLGDLQNPVNDRALLVAESDSGSLRLLGYVPDYLVAHTNQMIASCSQGGVEVVVEHVNGRGTPRHMRVLCRITSCWPQGYSPFSDDDYRPIGGAAVHGDLF